MQNDAKRQNKRYKVKKSAKDTYGVSDNKDVYVNLKVQFLTKWIVHADCNVNL